MPGLKEVLKEAVLSVLPSLSPDVTKQLVEKLMDQGVEGLDDLVYAKDNDILEFLRPIQFRKRLSAWKKQGKEFDEIKLGCDCDEWGGAESRGNGARPVE